MDIDRVVCVHNVGHTDGLRPLVPAVAVMFNRTILCDITASAKCIHHLRESELSLQSHFARRENVLVWSFLHIAVVTFWASCIRVKQWNISSQELFKGLCELVMEVLCVSLEVRQIFKIMFRWAAFHEGLMMLYRMYGLCMSNERG